MFGGQLGPKPPKVLMVRGSMPKEVCAIVFAAVVRVERVRRTVVLKTCMVWLFSGMRLPCSLVMSRLKIVLCFGRGFSKTKLSVVMYVGQVRLEQRRRGLE
jgi:hypothetical protein